MVFAQPITKFEHEDAHHESIVFLTLPTPIKGVLFEWTTIPIQKEEENEKKDPLDRTDPTIYTKLGLRRDHTE